MVQPWNLGPNVMDFSALGNLGKTYQQAADGARKRELEDQQRLTLANLGQDLQAGNFDSAAQKAFAIGDTNTGLGIMKMGQSAKDREFDRSNIFGAGAAPSAAAPSLVAPVAVGSPNEIETKFVDTVRGAGLTNPVGLAAVAAYGRAESGYKPENVNRSWSDPSESGQPGTSGGLMSWRGPRLEGLQNFAKQRGEAQPSVETQALYLAQEDPQLIPRLNAAKSPEEANSIMANAWRFAGYDRPGGENERRLALTKHYAGRFGSAAPAAPGVQVAETEADVQRLEAAQAARSAPQGGDIAQLEAQANALQQRDPEAARQLRIQITALRGQTPPMQAPMGAQPVQVAQAAPQPGAPMADVPAQGAAPAQGFAIPGTAPAASIADDPKVQDWQRRMATARTESGQKFAQRGLELAVKDAERRQAEEAPTPSIKEYRQYRSDEKAAGRAPDDYTTWKRGNAAAGAAKQSVNVGGGSDKQIFDAMEKGAEQAQSAATGLQSIREARRAVEGGGFFGAGADIRLGLQKAAAGLGIGDSNTLAKITNTETFRSAIAPQIAATMKATVGSTQISNADREFAAQASGGSIALDPTSIKRLLDIMEKANTVILERHQKRLDTVYPDEGGKFGRERSLFGVAAPQAEVEPAPVTPGAPAPASPQQRPAGGTPRTITNPKTGERMLLSPEGQWVPYS